MSMLDVPEGSVQAATAARWYCVQTKPRAESTALEHLARQRFHCFLPRVRLIRLRGGRRSRVVEPLFPRYLFLQARPELESLAPVRSTRGVLGLVRFGGRIAEAPGVLIQRLIADADSEGVILRPDNAPQPGDRVRIVEGLLQGLEGVYTQMAGEVRAVILLNFLGSAQRIVVPAKVLERLPASAAA